jgi:hypothetical protein
MARSERDCHLRHEILCRHAGENPGRAGMQPPSSPQLPDWLEEAVTWFVAPDRERSLKRLAVRLAAASAEHIPLRRLFAMEEPRKALADALRNLELPKDKGVLRLLDPGEFGPVKDLILDAESLSVLEFIVERFGVELVREVVARACAGEGPEAALPWLAAHPPPDGSVPPATVPELEAAWLDWVRPGFARLLVK